MIEHDNIFYIRDFSELGGVETFTFEMVKKFHKYDIAVVYKTAHINQLNRVRKYCRCYQHINEKIKCKTAIINYDVSIIDYIDENADIYQVIHADYENKAYQWLPPTHKRIKNYIAITKHIEESFKRITGLKNVIQMYNPLSIEKDNKLILLSATRLSKVKGKERMQKLCDELDRQKVNYLWLVFTNDKNELNSQNVIFLKPRLDINCFFDMADILVQLSDTEGLSYSINEMLYRNKPCILTPLPYLDEIGVKDGVNSYILEFDCSNIEDVVKRLKKKLKFKFNKLEEDYDSLLSHKKSNYEKEKAKLINAECTKNYTDLQHRKKYVIGDIVKDIDIYRYEYLRDVVGVVK